MKIYRALSAAEYKSFVADGCMSVKNSKSPLSPARFLFPEVAHTPEGKFFYFQLNDPIAYSYYIDSYKFDNNIMEMEISKEEAYKYFCCGRYSFDLDDTGRRTYCLPEVYLPLELVNEKIKKGEYRIIDFESRKDVEMFPGKEEREAKFIEIGELMGQISVLRSDIEMRKGFKADYKESEEKLKKLLPKFDSAFRDFANEHEKYMKLQVINENSPEKQ